MFSLKRLTYRTKSPLDWWGVIWNFLLLWGVSWFERCWLNASPFTIYHSHINYIAISIQSIPKKERNVWSDQIIPGLYEGCPVFDKTNWWERSSRSVSIIHPLFLSHHLSIKIALSLADIYTYFLIASIKWTAYFWLSCAAVHWH